MIFHIWGVLCRVLNEDPCSYQPEYEDSSGDHKGEMHAREECLLIPHKRSQDRDPYDTTNLSAHIQRY
jgi:hypothetical protein